MELQTNNMQVTIAPIHQEQISASEQAVLKITTETNATSPSSVKHFQQIK